MEIHHRDRYYLGSFGGDIKNADFLKKYERYRTVWEKANNVGELPVATLFGMAVAYPLPEVKEEPVKVTTKKQKVAAETL